MDVGNREDGAFRSAFLRSLHARGLSGVELVISDAHQGLQNAIATVFAGAGWQRCRTHFMANRLARVPKRSQPGVAAMVGAIHRQLSPEEVHAQAYRVVAQLRERFPQAVRCWRTPYPTSWPSLASRCPIGRSSGPTVHWSGSTRRSDAAEPAPERGLVGIFPNRAATRRLVGAVLAEQHDEWAEARRYLTIANDIDTENIPPANIT